MPNLRIIADNAADRATLTASSTAGVLAATNLVTDKKSDVWRAIGKTERLTLAWAVAEAIACVALLGNFSPTTTMRVRTTNEAQVTNLFTHSERFDSSGWARTRCVVSQNGVAAPDGSASAQVLTADGNGSNYAYQQKSLVASKSYTVSVYFKPIGYTGVFQIHDFTDGGTVQLNLGTMSLTASGNYSAPQLQSVGNGWYRISATVKPSSDGNKNIGVFNTSTAGSVAVWGAMLNEGGLSSYYPSTETFTSRASVGTYFDSTGVLQSAAMNLGRMNYAPDNLSAPAKLLLEAAATNSIRNNTMAGVAAGTPGTLPNNWSLGLVSGLSSSVVGTGAEKGIPYVNIRIFGTPTGSSAGIRFESTGNVAAAGGQAWCGSLFLRQLAGSTANLSKIALDVTGYNSSLVATADDIQGPNLLPSIATGNLAISRFSAAGVLSDATTAFVRFQILMTFTSGAPVDITLSIGMPQLEQGLYPTSAIATSSAVVTRSADVFTSAAGTRPLGYIDSWQSYDYDSGSVLACPAPAIKLRGWTAVQAASAYAYGGGAWARHWMPNEMQAVGLAVDIADQNNLQGYIEAARLVAGPYWSPTYNTSSTSATVVDGTTHYRTAAGDLMSRASTVHKRVPIELEYMPAADRAVLAGILRGSRAYPIFLSVFPGHADLALERDYTVYGKRMSDSEVAVQAAITYGTKIEVESI